MDLEVAAAGEGPVDDRELAQQGAGHQAEGRRQGEPEQDLLERDPQVVPGGVVAQHLADPAGDVVGWGQHEAGHVVDLDVGLPGHQQRHEKQQGQAQRQQACPRVAEANAIPVGASWSRQGVAR